MMIMKRIIFFWKNKDRLVSMMTMRMKRSRMQHLKLIILKYVGLLFSSSLLLPLHAKRKKIDDEFQIV